MVAARAGKGGQPVESQDGRRPAAAAGSGRRPGSRPPALLPVHRRCSHPPTWFHIWASRGSVASSDEGSDMVTTSSSSRRAGMSPHSPQLVPASSGAHLPCSSRPPRDAVRMTFLSWPWWKATRGHTDVLAHEGHGYCASMMMLQYIDDGATLGQRQCYHRPTTMLP
jgi:hypothetical protein